MAAHLTLFSVVCASLFLFLFCFLYQLRHEEDATIQKCRKYPVPPFPHNMSQVSVCACAYVSWHIRTPLSMTSNTSVVSTVTLDGYIMGY